MDHCKCVLCNSAKNRARQSALLSTAPGIDGPCKWVEDEGANLTLYSELLTLLEAEGDCELNVVENRSMENGALEDISCSTFVANDIRIGALSGLQSTPWLRTYLCNPRSFLAWESWYSGSAQ